MVSPVTIYDTALASFKRAVPAASFTVTHQQHHLTAEPDTTTGQYPVDYETTQEIEAVIIPKAAQSQITGTGLYIQKDALALTKTAVTDGDRIALTSGVLYYVDASKAHPYGDQIVVYELQLSLLPFTEEPPT